MQVYDELPKANTFVKNKSRSLAITEGWLDRMNNLDFSYQWLRCKTWPLIMRDSAYKYADRYRKIHPDYEWACRQIAEDEVALFGRRKQ